MAKGIPANLHIGLPTDIGQSLAEFCDRKKISRQDAVLGLLGWFLRQDGLLQSMLVGQLDGDDHDELAKLILARMETRRGSPQMRIAGKTMRKTDVKMADVEAAAKKPLDEHERPR